MNGLKGFDIIFPREYLRAALLVSLLSVWVLVGLFYYLNRYTKRYYFTVWTAAWLFYALWLTIGITVPALPAGSWVDVLRGWCMSLSAVFLLWGSLSFLEFQTPQSLFGWFIGFLLIWGYAGRLVTPDPFYVQFPTFMLTGVSSMFAGVSFYRLRKRRQFVAVGLLFLGFFLWGLYLMTYPFSQRYDTLINAGFLFSAVLQLFIAVSMIVLVLEEARHINEEVMSEIHTINTEKRELQVKVLTAEEKCRSLFHQARLREDLQSAYDELRQTQQSVVQQERLLALGQMASGMAHDINNALSPILAFAEMVLKRESQIGDQSRKNLEHIRTAAEDIAQIVSRMSVFFRRREQKDQLNMVPVKRLFEQVVELTSPCWRDMAQSRGASVRIETEYQKDLPELYCNESEVREALTNLVFNAVDALPKGGQIWLCARAAQLEPNNGDSDKPSHMIIEVKDNGMGMDEQTRQRCLEPFFSTKQLRGGSGLGLAMVYGTMERHEGRIEVDSEVNKGTTARLVFPIREVPKAKQASGTPRDAETHRPLNVLCIDDEPLLRELLKDVLEFQHHRVETADGGEEGLRLFEGAAKRGKPFDVVITDLGMPGLNGRQVAEKIREEAPWTGIVMLTGWGMMLEERGEKTGNADVVLSKPPRVDELVQVVTRVAASKAAALDALRTPARLAAK